MINDSSIARIAKVLGDKQTIAICLPTNTTIDSKATALALYLALLQMGKTVNIASSESPSQFTDLVGEDKIQNSLVSDGDDLVVSFPYTEGSIDKVTYNIEGDRFNLLIQPREGQERLNPEQVKYSYTGGKPEVVITVYAPTLNSLGQLYTSNKDQFTGVEIINIDRHFTNSNYGSINFVDKKSASLSEMILELLQSMKINIDKDIATNLHSGIVSATNNFTAHSVNAQTFEAIAFLLKHGAVKKPAFGNIGNNRVPTSTGQPMGGNRAQFDQNQPYMPSTQQQYQPPQQPEPTFSPPQYMQPQPQQVQPMQQVQPEPEAIQQPPLPVSSTSPEIESAGVRTQDVVENKEVKKNDNNPKDWLKPKIFQGSKLI